MLERYSDGLKSRVILSSLIGLKISSNCNKYLNISGSMWVWLGLLCKAGQETEVNGVGGWYPSSWCVHLDVSHDW